MIYGRIDRLDRYRGLSENLDKALDFLSTGDFAALPMGTTELDGENVFVNRFDYDTVPQSITEGHLRYTDIHVVLEGEEKVGVADVSQLHATDRREQEDFVGFEGEFGAMCTLRPGDFLIVFSEDAHCPKLWTGTSTGVKKIVVKVKE